MLRNMRYPGLNAQPWNVQSEVEAATGMERSDRTARSENGRSLRARIGLSKYFQEIAERAIVQKTAATPCRICDVYVKVCAPHKSPTATYTGM
jgi:hypothetical protein